MPKAYWIASGDVLDPEKYEIYKAANAKPFAEYGARFVVRGGTQEAMEGTWRSRTVVIEFPSLEAAQACYNSADYQAAKALRAGISESDLVIVEGYEG
ncbi:MAG: DUF1330 domain-containing protein [Pseudomonadota bacterium]